MLGYAVLHCYAGVWGVDDAAGGNTYYKLRLYINYYRYCCIIARNRCDILANTAQQPQVKMHSQV